MRLLPFLSTAMACTLLLAIAPVTEARAATSANNPQANAPVKKSTSPAKKKSKKRVKTAGVPHGVPPGVPTVLPAYKGASKVLVTKKKTIKIDFTQPTDHPSSDQKVADQHKESDAALAKALADDKAARKSVQATLQSSANSANSAPSKPSDKVIVELPIEKVAQEPELKTAPQPSPIEPVHASAPPSSPAETPSVTTSSTSTSTSTSTLAPAPSPSQESKDVVQYVPQSVATDTARSWREAFHSAQPRVFLRGGYLGAAYSDLEPKLENGATLIGLAISRQAHNIEGRVALDVIHGKDQAVTPANTRMLTLRVDASYFISDAIASIPIRPFAGLGVGYSDYDVRSYRRLGDGSGNVVFRDHAKGGALSLSPRVGLRFDLSPSLSFDVEAEYLALFGQSEAKSLGGFLAAGALGFAF